MVFDDRRHAGRALARVLRELPDCSDSVVLALPRGGVPVAFEVARHLRLPLDIFLVRKLGVPGQEELAMGAVAGGGIVVLNEPVIRLYSIRPEIIDAVALRENAEIQRRTAIYRGRHPPIPLKGRAVILVDDGLATGSTMRAAIRALRPIVRRIVVAVPVGAAVTCSDLRSEVDSLICLETPAHFQAVGEFYRSFDPTSDDEVRALLEAAWPDRGLPHPA